MPVAAHEELAAELQKAKEALTEAQTFSHLLESRERGYLQQIARNLDNLVSQLDGAMFRDHPDLPQEYTRLYYGGLDKEEPAQEGSSWAGYEIG